VARRATRRCGWLDIPVLRHAVRVNGLSELALTKLDVLAGLSTLKIAVAYEVNGKRRETPPPNGLETATPIYEELPGFEGDLGIARSLDELPENARAFIARVEELAGVPVSIASVGPGREQTIVVQDPWR
jgi:adenylosuccinate synthase